MDIKLNHNKLSAVIVESGMSQKSVAAAMNVSHNTINNWCNGRAEPTVAKFMQLLSVIGWDEQRIRTETRLTDWWPL